MVALAGAVCVLYNKRGGRPPELMPPCDTARHILYTHTVIETDLDMWGVVAAVVVSACLL